MTFRIMLNGLAIEADRAEDVLELVRLADPARVKRLLPAPAPPERQAPKNAPAPTPRRKLATSVERVRAVVESLSAPISCAEIARRAEMGRSFALKALRTLRARGVADMHGKRRNALWGPASAAASPETPKASRRRREPADGDPEEPRPQAERLPRSMRRVKTFLEGHPKPVTILDMCKALDMPRGTAKLALRTLKSKGLAFLSGMGGDATWTAKPEPEPQKPAAAEAARGRLVALPIVDLRAPTDTFRCEPFSVTLMARACVARQQTSRAKPGRSPTCERCPLGERVARAVGLDPNGTDMVAEQPRWNSTGRRRVAEQQPAVGAEAS